MVHFSLLYFLLLAASTNSSPVEKHELSTKHAAVNLVEIWDCGPEKFKLLSKLAEISFNQCPSIKDSANMCCKDHDYCYATHELHNFTHEFCDFRFCGCLQDAQDLNNNQCNLQIDIACNAVQTAGGPIYTGSHPKNATELKAKLGGFADTRPLDLDMETLVGQCGNAKGMAVHCHNWVHHCLENEKENKKKAIRGGADAGQDCESIMYECLQIIADSNDTEPCPSLARRMSGNLITGLSVERHGHSAIEIYPIISARLIRDCPRSTESIERCLLDFDSCALKNREAIPENFNAARRVKIACHQTLKACIEKATKEESEGDMSVEIFPSRSPRNAISKDSKAKCYDAKQMALTRIRDVPYEKHGWFRVHIESLSRAWNKFKESAAHIAKNVKDFVVDKVGKK